MKPIRIFRHVAYEGPGYLGVFLKKRRVPYEIVAIDEGQGVPDSLDDVSGLVFMGGPMSVNDNLPWIVDELALIRKAAKINLPILGHCLGGQLISKALGGSIVANKVKEIGWFECERLNNPEAVDWLGGMTGRQLLFHWHGETFSLPPGAVNVLKSEGCEHQAFVLGNILAMQCHIEMTAEMVALWADINHDELATSFPTVQSRSQMMLGIEEKINKLHSIADAIYSRWLVQIAC